MLYDTIQANDTILSNPIMDNVETAFANISKSGTRDYYKSQMPISGYSTITSHFKGVARYKDKMIFSYTNVGGSVDAYGKYLISQVDSDKSCDITDGQPAGWLHPGGTQVCGSFMVVGIQQKAYHANCSKIQIYNVSKVADNNEMTLIGSIDRDNQAVNGTAMTKEVGEEGRYIVAAIQGAKLTLYRSVHARLIADDSGRTAGMDFQQIGEITFSFAFPGIALVTQKDGSIYLFGFNANDKAQNNTLMLFKLNMQNIVQRCGEPFISLGEKTMMIPRGNSIFFMNIFEKILVGSGIMSERVYAILSLALNKVGFFKMLGNSFRWGKGLNVVSCNNLEVYATVRNVLPEAKEKNFSVVTWKN